ncbi:MAG TPA: RNA 2',3'-cyclic phosphodiesterase [Desulfobacteraceae bacterium]|nr:RNA 2',3'-cyclic phosphodiesterase [Desulfobacteraceae bacterium]|tara:strand:+ start:271 stop:846 length:576 start_codon:yes stop_codon:yes gene_type:complete
MKTNAIRCFIAVAVPDEVKQYLSLLQKEMKNKGIKASWADRSRFHITLAFLGDTAVDKIPRIQTAIDEAIATQKGFDLRIGPFGVFPNRKKARVIWAGVHGDTTALKLIYRNLGDSLDRAGMPVPRKKFVPHITLARIKYPPRAKIMDELFSMAPEISSLKFHVEAVELYQSILYPTGAVHKKLLESKLLP